MRFIFDPSQMKKFRDSLSDAKKRVKDDIFEAVTDSVLLVQNTSKRAGYVPYKTGNLKRSITHNVDRQAKQVIGEVGTNLIYAPIQEFGGTIRARGDYLVFRIDGHWVKTKSVRITGKRYLGRAVDDSKSRIQKRFQAIQIMRGK